MCCVVRARRLHSRSSCSLLLLGWYNYNALLTPLRRLHTQSLGRPERILECARAVLVADVGCVRPARANRPAVSTADTYCVTHTRCATTVVLSRTSFSGSSSRSTHGCGRRPMSIPHACAVASATKKVHQKALCSKAWCKIAWRARVTVHAHALLLDGGAAAPLARRVGCTHRVCNHRRAGA